MADRAKRIAVIAGDGIGPEVVRQALKVLSVLREQGAVSCVWDELPYGAEHYLETGVALPPDEPARFAREYDALLVGAFGDPRVADDAHARGILLRLRVELDLFINFRPARLLTPRLTPLRTVDERGIDLALFRENTEGPYSGLGAVYGQGSAQEVGITVDVNTRRCAERLIRAACEWARAHRRRRVTLSDKANAMPDAHGVWRRAFERVGAEYPELEREQRYVDALCMELVREPGRFDVIVAPNLLGDILSDLAAEITGGPGLAPSANLHPGRIGLFEPVHGSAPALAGKDVANPLAAILSLALCCDALGWNEAAAAVRAAIADAIEHAQTTPDLGGSLGTEATGDAVAARVPRHLPA
jgi:3-isopropylmalate dehydrogenase